MNIKNEKYKLDERPIDPYCGCPACRSFSRALIVGLAVGAVFFLLLLTVGVLLFESMSLEAGGLGLLCGGLCGGAAAGLMGSKPKKKRRKK